jgi:radical SAM protein with 4Fe4S-binding SPASM domain
MAFVPELLVIKPTLACTAACPTCALRRDLYRKRIHDPSLTLEQWRQVIEDARSLGCTRLHISGGEPTLYSGLTDLIRWGKNLGLETNVNTNGSVIGAELAEQLASAGLDSITVSLYGWNAAVHDKARQEQGLFDRALHAIRCLNARGKLRVDVQTVLANFNVTEFAGFLEMAYRLQVGNIYVSYVEGDTAGNWLPEESQIEHFHAVCLPEIETLIDKYSAPHLKKHALDRVRNMFGPDRNHWNRYASGIYFPRQKPDCSRPAAFALVLANGEVHPCNGVEYRHQPVMGNIHQQCFPALWNSEAWNRYRVERQDWCRRCPMTLHFAIPVSGDGR